MKILPYSQMVTSKGRGETVFEQVADGPSAKGHKVDCLYCDYDVPAGKIKEDQKGRHAAVSVKIFLPIENKLSTQIPQDEKPASNYQATRETNASVVSAPPAPEMYIPCPANRRLSH